ncbi:MAG: prepilin-type N-terminal cleavage/methylation domain-containing protein [Candidatus Babeliales bacterium]
MFGIYKSNKQGFGLIEILVTLTLVVLLSTMLVPRIRITRKHEQKHLVAQLEALTQFARRNALITGLYHKITFDLEAKTIYLTQQKKVSPPEEEPTFQAVRRSFITTSITLPPHINVAQFYIDDKDEIKQYESLQAAQKLWFFISPQGVTQNVLINFYENTQQAQKDNVNQCSLIINPFSGTWKLYDFFQTR